MTTSPPKLIPASVTRAAIRQHPFTPLSGSDVRISTKLIPRVVANGSERLAGLNATSHLKTKGLTKTRDSQGSSRLKVKQTPGLHPLADSSQLLLRLISHEMRLDWNNQPIGQRAHHAVAECQVRTNTPSETSTCKHLPRL